MVNILDVEIEELKEKYKDRDRLAVIFELVKEQNDSWRSTDLSTKEGQKQWKEILFCLAEELFEAANVLKNRDWAKTEYPVDYNHLFDELGDSTWFFIALLQISGFNAQLAFENFLRKYKVNQFRKESNY